MLLHSAALRADKGHDASSEREGRDETLTLFDIAIAVLVQLSRCEL